LYFPFVIRTQKSRHETYLYIEFTYHNAFLSVVVVMFFCWDLIHIVNRFFSVKKYYLCSFKDLFTFNIYFLGSFEVWNLPKWFTTVNKNALHSCYFSCVFNCYVNKWCTFQLQLIIFMFFLSFLFSLCFYSVFGVVFYLTFLSKKKKKRQRKNEIFMNSTSYQNILF
jgi:hypothetical protein